jgi:hypothetical protein
MIAVLTLVAATAWAYIPEYSMIASRAADQHGKGAYQIEQDVTIKKEAESFSVRETWIVFGENSMLLKIEGKGPLKGLVSGSVIYDGNSRIFYDGSLRSQKLGDEWLEPFFHFRNSRFFRSKLVSLKVAPQDSLRDRAPLASEGEIKYEPPNFIRLARAGGGISWAIGMNPVAGESPTMWLEQDQFVLRKYKSLNQSILRADDYAKYEGSFWYPRSRTYQFGGFTVTVQTVRVQTSGAKAGKDPRFKGATLAAEKDLLKLPDVDGLRDFYQRFR